MSTSSITTRSGRARFALITLVVSCIGGATFALPQCGKRRDPSGGHVGGVAGQHDQGARGYAGRSRAPPADDQGTAIAALNLVLSSPQPTNFTISGDLTRPLEPGLAAPLDLALTNPGPAEIAISSLQVSLASVSAPHADVTHPCTVDDFRVDEFSGSYGFTLGSSSTSSLSELGFPAAQWPQVAMPDRPVNQNGCKGASLTLGYTGTSTEGT